MSSANRGNFRDYFSDIDDGYDTESEVIAELDELEITDEANGSRKPDWEQSDNVMEYATSRPIAIQHLQFREKYVQEVQSRGCPLPELKKVVPGITGWNRAKSGIDSPCHFLSESAPNHKRSSAPKMFFLRDIRYRGYHAMIKIQEGNALFAAVSVWLQKHTQKPMGHENCLGMRDMW